MPKEHAGGVSHAGLFRVPGEWSDEQRFAIKIEFFDFDSLDSIDDLVREQLALKGTVVPLLKRLVALELEKAHSETAAAVLSEIIKANDAGMATVGIAIAFGLILTAEESMEDYAKQFGVSKQDMHQAVKGYCEKFGFRKTRNMRDAEAKKLMSMTNFRKQLPAP